MRKKRNASDAGLSVGFDPPLCHRILRFVVPEGGGAVDGGSRGLTGRANGLGTGVRVEVEVRHL